MMFSCLPVGNEHECCIVLHFVSQYNELNGTSYRVVDFPELRSRNTKEPEALLEALEEGPPLAIERKSIVHPSDTRFVAKHRNGHHFFDGFMEQLDAHGFDYSDTLYRLTVYERDLNGKRQKEIPNVVEQVSDSVLRNRLRIDESYLGIGGKSPIEWEFRVVPSEERDFEDPENGIVYTIGLERPRTESPDEIEEMIQDYAQEFEHQAVRAAEKFVRYPDYRKLLLVQFFGATLGGVEEKDIIDLVKSARLPAAIDEVWVAREEWVGLLESEIRWDHVR